jgi:hypothetical protein
VVIAVAAPLAGRLLRRRRPDLPRIVATDYAGTALLVAIAAGVVAAGLAHRPAVQAQERAFRAQEAAVRSYLLTSAPPPYRGRLGHANTLKLDDGFYRTCVPAEQPRRAFCLLVRTTQSPPVVREDPDRSPNALYARPGAFAGR